MFIDIKDTNHLSKNLVKEFRRRFVSAHSALILPLILLSNEIIIQMPTSPQPLPAIVCLRLLGF
jgi:hypothetical protein